MEHLRQLLRKAHRHFLWQALVAYLLFAPFAFMVAGRLVEDRNLPPRFALVAIVLLVVGLPIVLATAYIQKGIPRLGRSDPTSRVDVEADAGGQSVKANRQRTGARRVFTWRNAILGGVAAFTLWALVAAAWLLLVDELVDSVPDPGAEAVQADGN